MATLNQVTSTTVWIRTIPYLMRRVGKEGSTRHIVEGLRPSVEALDRVSAAVELAQRALVGARADVDAADNDIDEELAILEFNLLPSVGRNRKAAAYRKVFPEGLTRPKPSRSSSTPRPRARNEGIRGNHPSAEGQ